MKKLLFILLMLISVKGYSQIQTTPTFNINAGNRTTGLGLGVKYNNIIIEYNLIIPYDVVRDAFAGTFTAGYNFILTNRDINTDENISQFVFTPSVGYSIYNRKIKDTNVIDYGSTIAYGAEASVRQFAGEFFVGSKSYFNKSFVHNVGLRIFIANL